MVVRNVISTGNILMHLVMISEKNEKHDLRNVEMNGHAQ